MNEKFIFREIIRDMQELADQNGNVVAEEEVRKALEDLRLEEEQIKLVFDYLIGQDIQIEGYRQKENPKKEEEIEEEPEWSGDESEFLSFYEEDLQKIQNISEREKMQLICEAVDGDALAKGRLIELYLPVAAKIAKEYEKRELPLGDLIQEANVGLMIAVESLADTKRILDADAFLREQIRAAIEEAIEIQKDSRRAGTEIAERVNYLNEAIQNLEEDLEHKVSLEELSAYLEMPEEEIQDILRMAGDEMKKNREKKKAPLFPKKGNKEAFYFMILAPNSYRFPCQTMRKADTGESY